MGKNDVAAAAHPESKLTSIRTTLGVIGIFAFVPFSLFGYLLHISMIGQLQSQVGTGTAAVADSIPIIPDVIYAIKVLSKGEGKEAMWAYGAVASLLVFIAGVAALLPEIKERS